ncbi:MDR family MFS transporter [Bacillus sp. JJ722]|uniref:MDR family MFS transporter n=1 Tax=Bacillus sp. JJ722 TaxID=3122973 RepID=UPI0030004509
MRFKDWNTNLKIRLGGEAIVNITFWMFFPFLAIYFSEEFGKTTAGLLLVFSQLFAVIANLMGGYCADRFGRKRMMVIASAGQGIAYLVFALASSPWLNSAAIGFICFTVVSVFSSFYYPASQAMVADVVSEKDRNNVFAMFYTSINLAVVIGPILGSIFYKDHRFELLLLAGITNLFLSSLLWKKTVETLPKALNKKSSSASTGGFQFFINQLKDYRVIITDRTFSLFILAGIFISMTFLQLDLLYPIYTKEVVHNQTLLSIGDYTITVSGEEAFGILVSENGLFVVLFTLFISKWMNNFYERNVFIVSSFIYGISMLIAASTHWIWGLILSMAVFSFAELMTVGIQNGFISKIAPENMRGQYFAASSLRYTIGRMIAPIAIPMTEWFGNTTTFLLIFGCSIASCFLYYQMFKKYEAQKLAA